FRFPGRLGNEVVGSGIQCAHNVGFAVPLGEKNHRNIPVDLGADTLEHVDTRHIRYLPVKNHQVIASVQRSTEKSLAGRKSIALAAAFLQHRLYVLSLFLRIFKQRNVHYGSPKTEPQGFDTTYYHKL